MLTMASNVVDCETSKVAELLALEWATEVAEE